MVTKLSPLLDLNTMLPAFEDQYAVTQERQKQETEQTIRQQAIDAEAARKAKTVSDQATQANQANLSQQGEIMKGISTEVDKAKKAIALTESKDLLDHVTLYMLQQADPSYTRDGNLRMIEYYNQAAQGIAGQGMIEQAGYKSQIDKIASDAEYAKIPGNDKLALLKLREAQGQELITNASDYVSKQAGIIQNTVSMQQNAMAQVPDEAIDSAIIEAQKTGTKTANVSGIEVPLSMLTERKSQLESRAYTQKLQAAQGIELTLNNMTAEQVTEAEGIASGAGNGYYSSPDGVSIPLARLRERRAALLQQDFQAQSNDASIKSLNLADKRRGDMYALQNGYNPTELATMLGKDGRDPSTGYQYDLDLLQEVYDKKKSAQSDLMASQLLKQQGLLAEAPALDNARYIDSIKATPGTPLAQLKDTQKSYTAIIAKNLEDPATDDMAKSAQYALLQAQRVQLDEAVSAQALSDASGDKDLAILHEAKIRGRTVPPDVLDNMIIERSKKGMSLAGILPQALNAEYIKANQAFLDEMNATENAAQYMNLTPTDRKAQASQQALQYVKQIAGGPITDEVLGSSVAYQGNPINGKMTPEKFLVMVHQSEAAATQQYQRDTNKSDKDMQKILSGQVFDPELDKVQKAYLVRELDKTAPGLGKAYVDWWTSPEATKMVGQYTAGKAASTQTPQDMAAWSLVAPDVQPSFSLYGPNMQQGYEYLFGAQLEADHKRYTTFNGDTRLTQAFLLEQTPGLTDSDKQMGMTIVAPILEEAKQRQLNYEQTTKFLEGKLRTVQLQNPEAKKVLKKMLDGRSAALKIVDDFASIGNGFTTIGGPMLGSRYTQVGPDSAQRMQETTSTFGWLTKMEQ